MCCALVQEDKEVRVKELEGAGREEGRVSGDGYVSVDGRMVYVRPRDDGNRAEVRLGIGEVEMGGMR